MNKIYFLLLFACAMCGAYFYGANVADIKCRMKYTNNNLETLQKTYTETTKKQKVVRDVVNKTGTDDIRRILRDKYTIAQ